MILPAGIADRLDNATDEEIMAAYVAAGLSEDYGQVVVDAVRGRLALPLD